MFRPRRGSDQKCRFKFGGVGFRNLAQMPHSLAQGIKLFGQRIGGCQPSAYVIRQVQARERGDFGKKPVLA